MFLKSTRSVLINIQPSVTSYKYMVTVQRAIQTVFFVFLCSDDNDTKCSKLLNASLRGTSGCCRCVEHVDLCVLISWTTQRNLYHSAVGAATGCRMLSRIMHMRTSPRCDYLTIQ